MIEVKIYGTTTQLEKLPRTSTYTQRYWQTRKDGIRQRYHHKVTRTQRYKVRTRQYREEYVKAKTGKEALEKVREEHAEHEWIEFIVTS